MGVPEESISKSNVPGTASRASSDSTKAEPQDGAVTTDEEKAEDLYQEQSFTKVFLLLASVLMSLFLVALDRTIISTVCILELIRSEP